MGPQLTPPGSAVRYPTRRVRGGQHRARRGHCGGTGTTGGDGQVRFPALPRDRHPASGHPRPDMPHHHRLPARERQRCPDRALPPGPPRNTRPPLPVASHTQIAHRPQRPLPGSGQPARHDHPTDPSGHQPQPTHRGGHARYPPRRGEAPCCGDQLGCAHQTDLVHQITSRPCRKHPDLPMRVMQRTPQPTDQCGYAGGRSGGRRPNAFNTEYTNRRIGPLVHHCLLAEDRSKPIQPIGSHPTFMPLRRIIPFTLCKWRKG